MCETIARISSVEFYHEMIAEDLRDYRGAGNRKTLAVSITDAFLRQLAALNRKMVN
jgi:hypothetical protein